MDPYSPYGFGHKNKAIFDTIFEAVSRFFVVVSGPYETIRIGECGHEKRGMNVVYLGR
jgi:hypothetical protein